ncbi:unnamed protein product [Polarella glacialis]|uniref:NADH:ubiquinone reductase (non-electrogenic) n=1 Tax=Polarella glacialis TaxID=89957 RepID=A0A813JYS5_POLGL|nr:unnamed protein product [Polarella glacialis]
MSSAFLSPQISLPTGVLSHVAVRENLALAIPAVGAPTPQAPQVRGRLAGSDAVLGSVCVGLAGAVSSRLRSRAAQKSRVSTALTAIPALGVAAIAALPAVAGAVTGAMEGKGGRNHKSGSKPKVVVIGSGWGASTFMTSLSEEEAQMYDITLVSLRNHFLYTPLLPSACMGTVEYRSISTDIRRLIAGKGQFLEARADTIDTKNKIVRCSRAGNAHNKLGSSNRFPEGEVEGKIKFDVEYDILVYAVGAQTNDFGCPGVQEHAYFFKEVSDAMRTRTRITDAFEIAALPCTTPEQRDALLSFVIVGGGPTGVEVAADLADFVQGDAADLYPELVPYVNIRLVNVGNYLLATYNRDISEASLKVFEKKGVQVLNGYRVIEITEDRVKLKCAADGELEEYPYGCVVWAAGIKENALTSRLKESLVDKNTGVSSLNVSSLQAKDNGIITDEWLQVRGSSGSIFAVGDAATVRNDRTLPFAKILFEKADANHDEAIDMRELRDLLIASSDEYPQLEEYANYLASTVITTDDSADDVRLAGFARLFGDASQREFQAFKKVYELGNQRVGARTARKSAEQVASDIEGVDLNKDQKLDFEEFSELLQRVDANLRPFPPTAQVAAQQGKYLAHLFAAGELDGTFETLKSTSSSEGPFAYFHKGSLAYLGSNEAAFDLPVLGPITGPLAGVAWKAYETISQISWNNRALVGLDWLRSEVFGRSTSRY